MGQGQSELGSQIDFKDSFVIASGQMVSSAIETHADTITAIRFPAAFSGSTISFLAAEKLDGAYLPLHGFDGLIYTVTATAGAQLVLDVIIMNTVNFVKVVSDSAELAERIITAVSQPL